MRKTPHLLTTAQAAAAIGVAPRTIHRLVSAGRMKAAFKVPSQTGAYLFSPDEVARVRSERQRAPAA